ncbi:biotin--[acetyl-CoA-carboxylase] ligase [Chloroflexota bacterium]
MNSEDLSLANIADNLPTKFVGKEVIYYPHLPSTMDAARQEAHQGATEGTVIIAGEQTQGRGRLKRNWLSPRGNVALSIILYPDISLMSRLIMVASLSVVRSIETVTGLKPQIKWPNDILINGNKVSGILIENELKGSAVVYVIIGIGINVNLRPDDYADISTTATSLNDEYGGNVSHLDIIRNLLIEIERLYLTSSIGDSIYTEWRDRLATLGKHVYIRSGDTVLEGVAESVDRNGALRVRHADGKTTVVVAGDVNLRDK